MLFVLHEKNKIVFEQNSNNSIIQKFYQTAIQDHISTSEAGTSGNATNSNADLVRRGLANPFELEKKPVEKKPVKKLTLANNNLFFAAESPKSVKPKEKVIKKKKVEKFPAVKHEPNVVKEEGGNGLFDAQDNEFMSASTKNIKSFHEADEYQPSLDEESEFCKY